MINLSQFNIRNKLTQIQGLLVQLKNNQCLIKFFQKDIYIEKNQILLDFFIIEIINIFYYALKNNLKNGTSQVIVEFQNLIQIQEQYQEVTHQQQYILLMIQYQLRVNKILSYWIMMITKSYSYCVVYNYLIIIIYIFNIKNQFYKNQIKPKHSQTQIRTQFNFIIAQLELILNKNCDFAITEFMGIFLIKQIL
ncbi:unnamed protein product [Paramecium sonneborni]|uniref:Transmembrane protein n=1 Tax=Paramecium sonneborni TaxID=65129 RepID=A0A8S1RNT5_9CILI|nr:unnamed protein product [Paramecium sonneborni]